MQYKALLLDLDGTTIRNQADALPSTKVLQAIKKAQKILTVSVITGRNKRLTVPVMKKLHINGPTVLLGGALIMDSLCEEILYHKGILEKDYYEVIDILRSMNISFYLDYIDNAIKYSGESYQKDVLGLFCNLLEVDVADKIYEEVSKIPTIYVHKMLSWQKGKLGLSIQHAETTKQHAVLKVAEMLGIGTKEIIGVGDGYNDFPLLMACGLKVAMGNAVDDLKAIADYIAPTVEEDGIADVIEKFILQPNPRG
jgi:HAD superfamily hydrolase (TIGR01484 family)